MSTCTSSPCSSLKDRFAWYEKLIARVCIGGAVLAVVVAMYQD